MEELGGIVQCVAQKESISFFVDVFKNKIDESLEILANAALNAELSEKEIEFGKQALMFQLEAVPPEMLSKDVRNRT